MKKYSRGMPCCKDEETRRMRRTHGRREEHKIPAVLWSGGGTMSEVACVKGTRALVTSAIFVDGDLRTCSARKAPLSRRSCSKRPLEYHRDKLEREGEREKGPAWYLCLPGVITAERKGGSWLKGRPAGGHRRCFAHRQTQRTAVGSAVFHLAP